MQGIVFVFVSWSVRGGWSVAGEGGPLGPGDGPVVDVAVGGRELHAGAGDLDGGAVDRGLEVGLGVGGGQVDAAVADVVDALVCHGVLVLVDEFAVVADPDRPVFGDVGVAVGGVAHRGGFLLVHHDVDAGAGDPVRVADDVAAAVGRGVGGDGGAVLLDDHLVGVGVGEDHLVAADGEIGGDVVPAELAAAEVDAVLVRGDVHGGAGRPVVLGSPVQGRPGVAVVGDPGPAAVHVWGGGDGDVLLDERLVRRFRAEPDDDGRRDADDGAVAGGELAGDLVGGGDGGVTAGDGHRFAVAAQRGAGDCVGLAVAEWFGQRPGRLVRREGALHARAFGMAVGPT